MTPNDWVAAHGEQIVETLRELVRHEPAATSQDIVESWLRDLGLETSRLVTPDAERPVVIGRAHGRGGGRSLILHGHVDVVSARDAARWTQGPFDAAVVDGRIVGRGAVDAKGSLVALVSGLACARALGGELAGDVTVVSVADEEIAGPGTSIALESGHVADGAIVGEPTALAVAPASRGAVAFRLELDGAEAHSGAAFLGVNAIVLATRYVDALLALQEQLDREPPHPLYASVPVRHGVNVATIHGGESTGVVPATCTVEASVGCVAGENTDDLKRIVEATIAATTAADDWLSSHPPRLTWLFDFEPGWTPPDHPLVSAAVAAGSRAHGHAPEVVPFLGGSELRRFSAADIPAIHLGPGELTAAHAYDESLACSELLDAASFAAELVLEWCA